MGQLVEQRLARRQFDLAGDRRLDQPARRPAPQ
jgi:hypothetical protein